MKGQVVDRPTKYCVPGANTSGSKQALHHWLAVPICNGVVRTGSVAGCPPEATLSLRQIVAPGAQGAVDPPTGARRTRPDPTSGDVLEVGRHLPDRAVVDAEVLDGVSNPMKKVSPLAMKSRGKRLSAQSIAVSTAIVDVLIGVGAGLPSDTPR